jgi:hypothetical protein
MISDPQEPSFIQYETQDLVPLSELVHQFVGTEWHTNFELMAELFTNILAHLISFNNDCFRGTDFNRTLDFISELITPLGYSFRIINLRNHPAMMITNSNDSELETFANSFSSNHERFQTDILVHAHIDVVGTIGELSQRNLITEFDNNGIVKNLYGRGVIDDLGQVVLALLALSAQKTIGKENNSICLLLTSDEELGCPYSSKVIRQIDTTTLAIDLEATGKSSGVYIEKIKPSFNITISLEQYKSISAQDNVIEKEVQDLIDESFLTNKALVLVTWRDEEVIISVENCSAIDALPDQFFETLLKLFYLTPEDYDEYSTFINPPYRSELDDALRHKVDALFEKNFPIIEVDTAEDYVPLTHVSETSNGRSVSAVHSFLTALTLSNLPHVIIFSFPEGPGRHGPIERLRIKDLRGAFGTLLELLRM